MKLPCYPPLTVTATLQRQGPGETAIRIQSFTVTIPTGDHVLNLLAAIRRECDGTLSYPAHFCKVGTCGACALLVDGQPRLGCRTLVRNSAITIAPPKGRLVLADLLTESAMDKSRTSFDD
jgi:succinate dehydrogenase/fumarate reductase-like Fe-S protein